MSEVIIVTRYGEPVAAFASTDKMAVEKVAEAIDAEISIVPLLASPRLVALCA